MRFNEREDGIKKETKDQMPQNRNGGTTNSSVQKRVNRKMSASKNEAISNSIQNFIWVDPERPATPPLRFHSPPVDLFGQVGKRLQGAFYCNLLVRDGNAPDRELRGYHAPQASGSLAVESRDSNNPDILSSRQATAMKRMGNGESS